ncbi:MAG: triple tyrosine motif-containing protein [Gammaproteobacteria bacterium]|nr:triple tyrosine motif-containing protein [Gammaproteobacteria bacterium]
MREVPPRPDWIEFSYAAPTFLRPEHLQFEHRLRGFDEDWFATRDRTALFRKPPPGRYTFEVRVRRNGSSWSEPAMADISIQRHLLQQPSLVGLGSC